MRNFIISSLVLLTLYGCGSESSQTDYQPFEGIWTTCTDFEATSERYTAFQEGGLWVDTYTQHIGLGCIELDESREPQVTTGTYTLGDKIVLGGVESVYQVNWYFDDGVTSPCYSIIGVDSGVMYFGQIDDDRDCRTPETRPIDLAFEFPYFRE